MDKISLLIVEDDKGSCNSFRRFADGIIEIELIGITEHEGKAIQLLKDSLPDVLVLDLELHEGSGNGVSLLNMMSKDLMIKKPYVIVTTNNSSVITYECVRSLGADFILSKHQNDYSEQAVIELIIMMKSTIIQKRNSGNNFKTETNETEDQRSKRIVRQISMELNKVAISPKFLGYRYLIDAIMIVIIKPMPNLSKIISKKHGKTEASVERAMQNAIERAWRTADIDDLLNNYTAKVNPEKGLPTITEFVYYYANKIKTEY